MESDPSIFAAVDLGSNSFHLTIAKIEHHNLQVIGRLKEKVRLASGLNDEGFLDEESQERALNCLTLFKQRLQGMNHDRIRAVGTFTLRKAKNAHAFLLKAERALGLPIEVISGREEARLIFEGVTHYQHSVNKQLIIDIGGGSTEFAIGEAFDPILLDSLQMGCVSFTQRYFSDGQLNKSNFKRAMTAARLELLSIQDLYLREGWDQIIGTSGTIESILALCTDSKNYITYQCLKSLRNTLIEFETIDQIELDNLVESRKEILPAGLAILMAIFKSLNIEKIETSPAALREGLLYELSGEAKSFDIRERAIKGLLARYHVDFDQARRVNQSALHIWQKVKAHWDLDLEPLRQTLSWAARSHEIGLSINYGKHQKHGEYILNNTDINGFSVQQKQLVALLIRAFRRKFPIHRFDVIDNERLRAQLIRLSRILRLAVLLNHRRRDGQFPPMTIDVSESEMKLSFPKGFLDDHPLLNADLEQEQYFLNLAGLTLTTQ